MARTPTPPSTARLTLILGALTAFGPLSVDMYLPSLPAIARVRHRYSHSAALGVLLFALASVWCGLASGITQLIIARGVQGVGAALMVPGSLALISANFGKERRGQAIGTWSGFTPGLASGRTVSANLACVSVVAKVASAFHPNRLHPPGGVTRLLGQARLAK